MVTNGDSSNSSGERERANREVEEFVEEMAPPPRQKNPRKKRTVCSSDDFGILLDYLEHPGNFEKLFGSGRGTRVGGKHIRKEAQWDVAAAELKGLGFPETTGKNLQKKWYRLFGKFKEAKALTKETGGGLTEDERQRGVTLEAKLNSICDHFYRWDALLGTRANVDPPAESGPMGFQHFEPSVVASSQGPPPSTTSAPHVDSSLPSPTQMAQSDVEHETDWIREQEEVNEVRDDLPNLPSVEPTPPPMPSEQTTQQIPNATPRQPADDGVGAGGQPIDGGAPGPTHTAQASNVPPSNPGTSGQGTRNGRNPNEGSGKGKKTNGDKGDQEKRSTSLTSKPSLASVFQESKAQEANFKLKYMERKEVWKMADIADRREARDDEFKRRKLELEFDVEKREWESGQREEDRKESAYQAALERQHRLDTAKQASLFSLAIALVNKDKDIEDIKKMYQLFDKS